MTKRKGGSILGPPDGAPWVWITTEMLASPAWRALSINGRRLVEFLIIEHRNHAGRENGNLKATHRQLVAFGLTAGLIRSAIDEAERLGFVRSMALGFEVGRLKRQSTRFRLTFYGGSTASPLSPATNEWKWASQNQKSTPTSRGRLPRECEAELPPIREAGPNVVVLKNVPKRNAIKGKAP